MCVCMDIYVIMKTMCPPSYHHNGFVATHANDPLCVSWIIYYHLYINIYLSM